MPAAPGHQQMPRPQEVFISYSRKDKEFVHRLDESLKSRSREAWVDWEDIRPTEDFMQAIYGAIEGADTFLFVLTPDSVTSIVCGREIAHAAAHNKRMVPIEAREVDAAAVPEPLAKLNWISFWRDGDDFEKATDTLISALDTDLDWVHAHTRLLTRAIEWENKGKNNSFVLRGEDLRAAEQWLAEAGAEKERHRTALSYSELGESYRLKKDYKQAREQLKMAISLDPEGEWPRRVLGITLRETGEYAEASAKLNEAIKIRPTKWGYVELARTYRLQGDYVHTLESISKAKGIDPNFVEAYELAASIQHDNLSNFEAAYQEYRKALEIGLSDEGDKADLAEATLTSGRFKEARLLASDLLRAPATTTELSLGGQLAMRFIVASSLLLGGEPEAGAKKLKELRDYYKTLPVGFVQSWDYRGTRNFVMQHPMNQAIRTKLIGALDMMEKGEKAARTSGAEGR
jgi:tetratricopeptide (TPR) repeat protein